MSILRSLGPAVAQVSWLEAFRAGFGAFAGLGVIALLLLTPHVDLKLGLYLVAPFGATSVLLFAIPNSPLAQPWSAIIGNTVAALVSIGVCMLVKEPLSQVALSVGLAIVAMILCRAVHPPAGAVAMTAAMSPDAIQQLGFWFALTPIAVGTTALVVLAAIYAKLTGRHYPFRQFDDPGKHSTADRNPSERLGLSEEELSAILERYRQSFNLGVEDLARLIGAAELQAASHDAGPLTAADIMSRDLITVHHDTSLVEVAELFTHHRFTSLPVTGPDRKFLGVIFQIHLIRQASSDTLRLETNSLFPFKRLLGQKSGRSVCAGDIMNSSGPRTTGDAPVASILPMMADGDVDAVPVLEGDRIVGIVTRTDLIGALARQAVRGK